MSSLLRQRETVTELDKRNSDSFIVFDYFQFIRKQKILHIYSAPILATIRFRINWKSSLFKSTQRR